MIPPRPPSPPLPPTPICLSKVLLVEGNTPAHFFEAMLRHLDLDDCIEIRNFGGVTDLRTYLITLASTSEFRTLVRSVGIVRDAEENQTAARDSVDSALTAASLASNTRASVFILPDNRNPGMLETLCIDAIRTDPAFKCVENYFDCLEQEGVDLPDDTHRVKAVVQTFLASRPDVQLFPGLAAYRGYWPWDSPVFEPLKQFLRSI